MTRPDTSSKLVLVEDPRAGVGERSAVPVRRYRLARLRFDGLSSEGQDRFQHIKRVYD